MPSNPFVRHSGESSTSVAQLRGDASDDESRTDVSSARPLPKAGRSGSNSSSQHIAIPSSLSGRQPTRSFFHHASYGSTDPVHYSAQGVRDQTEELATSFRGGLESFRSTASPHRYGHTSDSEVDSTMRAPSTYSESEQEDGRDSMSSSRPNAIEEVSEPVSPDFPATSPQRPPPGSNLTKLIQNSPPQESSDDEIRKSHDGDDISISVLPPREVEDITADETTPLVSNTGSLGRYMKRTYNDTGEVEQQTYRKKGWRGGSFAQFKSHLHPKAWSVQDAKLGVLSVVYSIPAVILGLLLNLLDALSYGTILFPLGDPIFEKTGPDGIAMFFVSTVIAQVVYGVGFSKFIGGVGSEMIEVVPFVHKMTFLIIDQLGRGNPEAVMATTIVAYAISSIVTGLIFFALGFFKLGNLVSFFPRSILLGCIGGVGIFLVVTGIEVTAGLKDNLEFNLETLEKLISGDTILLWTVPLLQCILLMLIQRRVSSVFTLPLYFGLIAAIFYIVYAALPHTSLDDFRNAGWLFEAPESGIPFYRFYSYYNFKLVDWTAILKCVPTMFALSFFGIIHVPINVPALAMAVQDENIDLNQELIAHGFSNTLSGFAGSIQNYLVYANSQLFMKNGGNSRLAAMMLAFATLALWIAGPGLLGFVPKCIVGALIYLLGFELIEEALIGTWRKINKLEYLMILVIAVVMGFHDFVTGIVLGIVLACLITVIQNSTESAIRVSMSGAVANSTVRRHVAHRRYLQEVGSQIHIIKLTGYLFFGSIVDVQKQIKDLMEEEAFHKQPFRYLILDFAHVGGIDFSAAEGFGQILRILRRRDVEMVLSGISMRGKLGKNLSMVGLFEREERDGELLPPVKVMEDLNKALEACENGLLQTYIKHSEALAKQRGNKQAPLTVPEHASSQPTLDPQFSSPRRTFIEQTATKLIHRNIVPNPTIPHNTREPLALILQIFQDITDKDENFWWRAAPYFSRREFSQGTIIYHRGEDPAAFYLLESGVLRADYTLETQNFQESIVAGTTCGELPFFSNEARTGTVVAEKECVVWALTREKWEEMERREPEVARELLVVVLKLTNERMSTITSHVLVSAG
ncbi:hypothetical protein K402DRAFT_271658 [Aulographum hederae CBS 113979]|uniref:Sulfate transporter family protein-like protein n=1 Tax=Aulographum hederae CBS 113979 TaxID=1176131 RepID=A0A6G1H843_9PEZI|nr:hypothetical protein K402DRAFT_271658 [Aulographum hederae CBS 113979]